MPPVSEIATQASDEDSAAWGEWGATPIPLVSEIAIQASDEDSAAWVDWGSTPVPGADSVSWDEWGSVPETTPMPAIEDEYDARTLDVYSALDKFVTAWEKKDLGTMRNMFAYDYDKWEKPEDAERLPNIVSLALMNGISPTNGDFIEDALDLKIPDDGSGVTVSVRITDVGRRAKYRFRIRMVRQPDESWRIDAGSFESFEELEYIGKTVIATRDLPHLAAMAECPEIAGSLRPVNVVVFDAKGSSVRFLVHSAAVRDEDVWFIFGVQDPDGILGDNYLADPFVFGEPADAVASYEYPVGLYDDHESHTCWYIQHVTYDRAAFPAGGEIGFGMDDIRILRTNAIDLMPYLREYGSQCSLIDLPEIHMWLYQDGKWQEYFNRKDYQLLDYTRRLDVALTAHEQLTGIGWKDGMLRIQFHSLDDVVTDETGYTYGAEYGRMFICKTANGFYDYDYQALEWAMEEDKGVVAWTEYQVPCTEADLDNMKLMLEFDEVPEVVHGQWRLLLRSDDVLVSATPVPGPEPTPMPEMEPTPVPEISGTAASVSPTPWSALEQSIKDSFPGIMEGLVPVGEYCERGGLRFTVHAAAAYDDVTYAVCSVQNLSRNTATEGIAFGDSPEWLQDIAAPSASRVIHFGSVEGEFASWYMVNFTYDGVADPEDRTVTIGINHIPEVSETGETVAWRETLLSVEIPLSSIWKETGKLPAKYSEEYFTARLKYIVNEDGTAAIVSRGNPAESYWSELVIPAEMDGRPVTAIADGAFADHLNLESVTLPDSVTSIGARAFSGCYRLSSVNFPENLVSIGDEAFWSANLTYPVLPASLEFIGENAFRYNHSLNCIVPEDSFALRYCEENGLSHTVVSAASAPSPTLSPFWEEQIMTGLMEEYPDLAGQLRPLNIFCEDQGIRLEIVSAASSEEEVLLVWTLEDLYGRYSPADSDIALTGTLINGGVNPSGRSHHWLTGGGKTWHASSFRYDELDGFEGTTLLLQAVEMETQQQTSIYLPHLVAKYNGQSVLSSVPESNFWYMDPLGRLFSDPSEGETRVLDPAQPLDVPLSGIDFRLGGITLAEDGLLHFQIYTDNPINVISDDDSYFSYTEKYFNMIFYLPDSRAYFWQQEQGGKTRTWIEYQVPCTPADLEQMAANFFEHTRIDGTWKTGIPLDAIHVVAAQPAAASGTDEPAQPAAVFQPGESPKTVSGQVLSTLESVRPGLKDRLFPVNLYWTDGTVRLDVISAAVGETESWVVYSLTNADLRFFGYLSDSLDDSPVSKETTEHYELYIVPSDNTTYYAARIRHNEPDPERKTAVLSLSDIETVEHRVIQDMKSTFLIYEPLSGDLTDLPDLTYPGMIITDDGKDLTPDEFRESGKKILDYTHSPDLLLSNGLELSGIRLEDGMLHIQLHTVEPYPSDENKIWPKLRTWFLKYDSDIADRPVCQVFWPDPVDKGEHSYCEYIIPWTMEDFDKHDLSIELFESVDKIKGPLSVEITRPE